MSQLLQKEHNAGHYGLLISRRLKEFSFCTYETVINEHTDTYNENMGYEIINYGQAEFDYTKIKKYFKKIAGTFEQIETDEAKLSGMPVVKGTRIPVSLIMACIKDEMTVEEICSEYNVEPQDIATAMEYVIEVLDAPYEEGLE